MIPDEHYKKNNLPGPRNFVVKRIVYQYPPGELTRVKWHVGKYSSNPMHDKTSVM
jgi:hypothetical protein